MENDAYPHTVNHAAVQFYRDHPRVYDCIYHSRNKARSKYSATPADKNISPFDPLTARDLNQAFAGVNVFECINAADYEARHSSLLAWLLDPSESHQLGVTPLKNFFKLCDFNVPVCEEPEAIEVHRERGRIDLFVVDRHSRRGLVIENKIHSGEHGNQLQRYRRAIATEFPGFTFAHIFLTAGAITATDAEYQNLSYQAVARWLDELSKDLPEPQCEFALSLLWHHFVDFVEAAEGQSRDTHPNLFQALRLREIRHSDFWGWLLDPDGSHGLGEATFRELLQLLSVKGDAHAAKLLQKPRGSFSDLRVLREENHADLIIVSETHSWVGLIEMKVTAKESQGQLARYRAYIEGWFPDHSHSFALMTLQSVKPSDPTFRQLSFQEWKPFFAALVERKPRLKASAELALILLQYRELLTNRLLTFDRTVTTLPATTAEIAATLWKKHEPAFGNLLSTVIAWQKRSQLELESFIVSVVRASFEKDCFRPDRFSGSFACYMPFVPNEWAEIAPVWSGGADQAFTGQLVNLTFLNFPFTNPFQNAENMGITLVIGMTLPRSGYEGLREIIYEAARTESDLFNAANKKGGAGSRKQIRLVVHTLVSHEECRRLPMEEVKSRFQNRWQRFRRIQYPRLLSLLQRSEIRNFQPVFGGPNKT